MITTWLEVAESVEIACGQLGIRNEILLVGHRYDVTGVLFLDFEIKTSSISFDFLDFVKGHVVKEFNLQYGAYCVHAHNREKGFFVRFNFHE